MLGDQDDYLLDGLEKEAAPRTFTGTIAPIWTVEQQGDAVVLVRPEDPFADLKKAIEDHQDDAASIEQALVEQAEDVRSMQQRLGRQAAKRAPKRDVSDLEDRYRLPEGSEDHQDVVVEEGEGESFDREWADCMMFEERLAQHGGRVFDGEPQFGMLIGFELEEHRSDFEDEVRRAGSQARHEGLDQPVISFAPSVGRTQDRESIREHHAYMTQIHSDGYRDVFNLWFGRQPHIDMPVSHLAAKEQPLRQDQLPPVRAGQTVLALVDLNPTVRQGSRGEVVRVAYLGDVAGEEQYRIGMDFGEGGRVVRTLTADQLDGIVLVEGSRAVEAAAPPRLRSTDMIEQERKRPPDPSSSWTKPAADYEWPFELENLGIGGPEDGPDNGFAVLLWHGMTDQDVMDELAHQVGREVGPDLGAAMARRVVMVSGLQDALDHLPDDMPFDMRLYAHFGRVPIKQAARGPQWRAPRRRFKRPKRDITDIEERYRELPYPDATASDAREYNDTFLLERHVQLHGGTILDGEPGQGFLIGFDNREDRQDFSQLVRQAGGQADHAGQLRPLEGRFRYEVNIDSSSYKAVFNQLFGRQPHIHTAARKPKRDVSDLEERYRGEYPDDEDFDPDAEAFENHLGSQYGGVIVDGDPQSGLLIGFELPEQRNAFVNEVHQVGDVATTWSGRLRHHNYLASIGPDEYVALSNRWRPRTAARKPKRDVSDLEERYRPYDSPLETFRTLVKAIGTGFHPDTPGADYTSLPEGYRPEDVDRIVEEAIAAGVDVYEVGLDVMKGLMKGQVSESLGRQVWECRECDISYEWLPGFRNHPDLCPACGNRNTGRLAARKPKRDITDLEERYRGHRSDDEQHEPSAEAIRILEQAFPNRMALPPESRPVIEFDEYYSFHVFDPAWTDADGEDVLLPVGGSLESPEEVAREYRIDPADIEVVTGWFAVWDPQVSPEGPFSTDVEAANALVRLYGRSERIDCNGCGALYRPGYRPGDHDTCPHCGSQDLERSEWPSADNNLYDPDDLARRRETAGRYVRDDWGSPVPVGPEFRRQSARKPKRDITDLETRYRDFGRHKREDEAVAQRILDLNFSSNDFMQPFIEYGTRSEVVGEGEDADDAWEAEDDEDAEHEAYWAHMSAPGYMDQTDWEGPFETATEAAEALAEAYGDAYGDETQDQHFDEQEVLRYYNSGPTHQHGHLTVQYAHGGTWMTCLDCGARWSVHEGSGLDQEGEPRSFDFEEVAEGSGTCGQAQGMSKCEGIKWADRWRRRLAGDVVKGPWGQTPVRQPDSDVPGQDVDRPDVGQCRHNEMVETGRPDHAWKCLRCGYVYGASHAVGRLASRSTDWLAKLAGDVVKGPWGRSPARYGQPGPLVADTGNPNETAVALLTELLKIDPQNDLGLEIESERQAGGWPRDRHDLDDTIEALEGELDLHAPPGHQLFRDRAGWSFGPSSGPLEENELVSRRPKPEPQDDPDVPDAPDESQDERLHVDRRGQFGPVPELGDVGQVVSQLGGNITVGPKVVTVKFPNGQAASAFSGYMRGYLSTARLPVASGVAGESGVWFQRMGEKEIAIRRELYDRIVGGKGAEPPKRATRKAMMQNKPIVSLACGDVDALVEPVKEQLGCLEDVIEQHLDDRDELERAIEQQAGETVRLIDLFRKGS